jgi:hypothetical protein
VTDDSGQVTADSRAERISSRTALAELAEAHRSDPLLMVLLKTYEASIRDPNSELVHLYEIATPCPRNMAVTRKPRKPSELRLEPGATWAGSATMSPCAKAATVA